MPAAIVDINLANHLTATGAEYQLVIAQTDIEVIARIRFVGSLTVCHERTSGFIGKEPKHQCIVVVVRAVEAVGTHA